MATDSGPDPASTPLTSHDPALGLRSVLALRDLADRLEALHVEHARELGWSWQDLAGALGVTRQAVHKKHARTGRTEA